MECPNCGYEIEKPNPKKWPVCGHKLSHKEQIDKASDATQESLSEIDTTDVSQSIPQDYTPVQHTPEPEMIECPRCNTLISVDNNFCPRCGYNMRVPEDNDRSQDATTEQSLNKPHTEQEKSSVTYMEHEAYNNDNVEEEAPAASDYSHNVRYEEDNTEFENGSYQPYTDTGAEDNDMTTPREEGAALTSWLIYGGTAVLSIIAGCLLYVLFE